jgi:hypothetical protein
MLQKRILDLKIVDWPHLDFLIVLSGPGIGMAQHQLCNPDERDHHDQSGEEEDEEEEEDDEEEEEEGNQLSVE